MLPDVLAFVAMLGSLRHPAASLHAAGKAPDMVEAAHSFQWAGGEDIFVTRAPGRLDLMGGIADYSGSLVLQMPIREACLVAMQRQPGGRAGPPGAATSEARAEMLRLSVARGEGELGRRLSSHGPEAEDAAARGAAPEEGGGGVLRVVSLGAEENNRGPTFELPLDKLLAGGAGGGPIEYEAARALFAADPSTAWASYVAGCVLVLAREKGVRFGPGGLTVLLRSEVPEGKGVSSSASIEVATMVALLRAFKAEVAAAVGGDGTIKGRELGLLAQMVENRVVGAPCGVMDQMASLLGQQNKLLALLCQPAEPLAYVEIPSSLAVWGIDSGIRHAVSGADYGSVRVGAFIGFRIMERLWQQGRQAARRAEAEDEIDGADETPSPGGHACASYASAGTESEADTPLPSAARRRRLGAGHLANVSPSEFEQHFADLPGTMKGADFLAAFPSGTGDTVTTLEPSTSYAVRQPTKHPIYEHFRVKSFAELLHGTPVATGPFGRQVEMLGELMYQSHQSYSACGLGSVGTDRIVELVRRAGIKRGLYGAKITGGGSGGTVAVLGHVGADEAIDDVVARYERELGHKPHIFTGSSPGALAFGHLRLRPV